MKTFKKVLLVIIIALLLACTVTVATIAIVGSNAVIKEPIGRDLSDWMKYIDDGILLKNTVIPGSHDSASKEMLWLGKTQTLTIGEQLTCGARYFDIRIQKTDKGYIAFHGPIKGSSAQAIFDDIKSFISVYTTETVILDFQHFKDGAENWVIGKVEEELFDYLLHNDTDLSDADFINGLTLENVRGKLLIMWGVEDENIAKDYVFLRDNDEGSRENSCLHSFYNADLNEKKSKEYVNYALQQYIDMQKQYDGLFVLQGQLTDGVYFRGPQYREATHQKRMSEYINNLQNHPDFAYINIIMRDFINTEKTSEIIKLNYYKGNVKADLLTEFVSDFVGSGNS